jgi:flap endonuclease-1
MGIKGINEVIKRHAPDAFFTLPIVKLSGKRIAVDAYGWMYANMAIARKKIINKTDIAICEPNPIEIRKEWFIAAINFIVGWISHNITVVFVFDGTSPPEKAHTKSKRRDARVIAKAKIDALYEQLNGDILERPANIVEELRKELRNYNFISPEDFELFKMIMKIIGIPCLQATGEAEQLCSTLCIERKVAVFSVDTDNLAHGCPLIITGYSDICTYDEYGNRISHLNCTRLDRVLSGLKISHSKFVDLCIMSGCDFNTNMPNYAAIKAYGLINKHGSIENLPRNFNTDCLKYERCREIFKYIPSDILIVRNEKEHVDNLDPELTHENQYLNTPSEEITYESISLDINTRAISTARDYLEMVGVSGQIDRIINSYKQMTLASDGYIEELHLDQAPRYIPPQKQIMLDILSPTKNIENILVVGEDKVLFTMISQKKNHHEATIPSISTDISLTSQTRPIFMTLNVISPNPNQTTS